jgi:hypothetical protein
MNPMIQCKPTILLLLIAGALACFGLLSKAAAVVPAPDGGYPGFNTAEGQNALLSRTTGVANTAVGWYSLFSNTDGSYNTGVGAGTLLFNVGDQTTGEGTQNTAIGAAALLFNTTGFFNTATGVTALLSNTTGVDNTATGTQALFNNTTGSFNTANGAFVLPSNATGDNNTAIGFGTLANNTTGSSNIALGLEAGFHITTADNVICIGELGENVSNSCYIGQIFGATSSGGTAVFINSDGRLGTTTSSRRFKEEIKPMERASEALFALKPVAFRYKKGIDPQGIPQFGLVAEDVEAVNPDLVVRDKEGKVNTVRYDAVNAMLLNEFLKEHEKVQEQQATIADLKLSVARQEKQIAVLASGLQRVSAQIEMSKSAPQMVTNNH